MKTLLRSRARTRARTILTFANAYPRAASVPECAWFADTVAEASSGDVRIRFVNNWADRSDRHEETTVATDVALGKADLGWVGSRVLGRLGARSFDALQAPLLFPGYEAQGLLWESTLPGVLLDRLESVGLVGLALLPGEMRKPFGFSRPLVQAADFESTQIRTHESTVADATFEVLGARPILLSTAEMPQARERCDGMDLHAAAVRGWGYEGYLTWNVNLWPRMTTIVANRASFEALGTNVQWLLRSIADETTGRAVEALLDQDRRDRAACPEGVSVVTAGPRELFELREQVEPVYSGLRSHPDSELFLGKLEQLLAGRAAAVPTAH